MDELPMYALTCHDAACPCTPERVMLAALSKLAVSR